MNTQVRIEASWGQQFAVEWCAAWNARDLERILAHYDSDIRFHSPRISLVLERELSFVRGKEELKEYWAKALAQAHNLHFEIAAVFMSSDALTILYDNHRAQRVAEVFIFGPNLKVVESVAAYAD
ncbi:MAG: nuclear transport factor 2 family protein [Spirochaetes bacterium]|nr:nuclear transport factor 2 family protein [Spirochaetota bacterium]